MIKGFVAGGLGVTILPELAGDHPGIELRPVRGQKPVRRVWAVTRETRGSVARRRGDARHPARGLPELSRRPEAPPRCLSCRIRCRSDTAIFRPRSLRRACESVRYRSWLERAESLDSRERGTQSVIGANRRQQLRRNATPFRVSPSANPAGTEGDDGSDDTRRQCHASGLAGHSVDAAWRSGLVCAWRRRRGARRRLRRRQGPVAPGQDRLGPLGRRPALEQGQLADRPDRLADRSGARRRRAGHGAERPGPGRGGSIERARQAARRRPAPARSAARASTRTRSSSSTSGWSRSTRATRRTTSRCSSTRTASTISRPAPTTSMRSTMPTCGSPTGSPRCATRWPSTPTRSPT